MNTSVFSALDYVALTTYLVLVVAIGVWVGRGQKDTKEYFLAGRSMGWFRSAFPPWPASTAPSHTWGRRRSTTPTAWRWPARPSRSCWWFRWWMFVFMPFFHRLQVYTAYEYLEERFDLRVRTWPARCL